jgi:hypothetical protein
VYRFILEVTRQSQDCQESGPCDSR